MKHIESYTVGVLVAIWVIMVGAYLQAVTNVNVRDIVYRATAGQ